MKAVFSCEEEYLLSLLKMALKNEPGEAGNKQEKVNMASLTALAKKHAVLPFLYDLSKENALFDEQRGFLEKDSRQAVMQSYRLLFLTKYVVGLLKEQGIPVIVLKGVATAGLYCVPELRKSGDVDLLVPEETQEKRLVSIMLAAGFKVAEEQHANHHTVFASPEGINVEVHTMLSEPFAYKKINQAVKKHMSECWEHMQMENIMGVQLPVLDKPFHAYELLLHMLQHFVYAGFGLKLLCDWVVIWRMQWSSEEKALFAKLVEESGLTKFAEAVTCVCIKYLGLESNGYTWTSVSDDMADNFLREVLDAEDFGKADNSRMVMMSGTGLWAYVKEFHHQMHLNFPRAGKCFLFWPVLWMITLVRFLINNHKVRKTSAGKVLKEAQRRSKLMEQLRLFD